MLPIDGANVVDAALFVLFLDLNRRDSVYEVIVNSLFELSEATFGLGSDVLLVGVALVVDEADVSFLRSLNVPFRFVLLRNSFVLFGFVLMFDS